MVEGKIMSLIVAAPARKLPPSFVDRTTGLVRTTFRSFAVETKSVRSCAPSAYLDSRKSGIYMRYRINRNGKDVFRWFGYGRG